MLRRTATFLHQTSKKNSGNAAAEALADRRRKRLEAGGGTVKLRHSGVQLDVLSLYRGLLKTASKKTDAGARARLSDYIRAEFKDKASIPRKEVQRIEWLIHTGRNRLEDLKLQKPTDGFSILR